ncbi:hypothetical protein BDW74DRAFT_78414 [Aspergillus multicolor]|uniref:uncharacterized protein n=1 Tax=Aspergillus multicolor TaxID=41759 RepID=UPI003CCE2557
MGLDVTPSSVYSDHWMVWKMRLDETQGVGLGFSYLIFQVGVCCCLYFIPSLLSDYPGYPVHGLYSSNARFEYAHTTLVPDLASFYLSSVISSVRCRLLMSYA